MQAGAVISGPDGAIRVALLIDHLEMGGAERILCDLAPRLLQFGVDPRVCILDGRRDGPLAESLRACGIPVSRAAFNRLLDPRAVYNLYVYLRALAPDVVHTQLECANTVGTFLGRVIGAATLTTLHTVEPKSCVGRGDLRLRAERLAIRQWADQILCVSRALLDQSRAIWRLPTGRLRVVYNGIDLAQFAPAGAATLPIRCELGLAPTDLVITTVAVLRRPKGLEFMVHALAGLVHIYPQLRYLVVGDGEDRARLEQLVAELGLTGHVVFSGVRTDVERVLQAADIFVLPSLTEALPTVIAEAGAAGLPVVATAVGGTAEMVDDGRSGFLVRPGDAIALATACARLLADRALRGRMGSRGREIAYTRFDLGRQAQELAQTYRELIRVKAARCA